MPAKKRGGDAAEGPGPVKKQPKKAAKAKAIAQAAESTGQESLGSTLPTSATATGLSIGPEAMKCNGEIFTKHMENVRIFKEEAVSSDIVQMVPDSQGFVQAFCQKAAVESLRRERRYMCRINLMWLDHSYSCSPHVPINKGAIQQLKQHYFQKACGLEQHALHVCILQAELDAGTFPAFGCWKRLSPEESVMAWFEGAAATATLVRDGAKEKEDELQEWLRHCLSTVCIVKVVENQSEIEWVSAQLREDMVQMAVLQRTPTQRIFDLVSKRESMGNTFTPEALVAMYDTKLKWSSTAEKLTVGCFDELKGSFPDS